MVTLEAKLVMEGTAAEASLLYKRTPSDRTLIERASLLHKKITSRLWPDDLHDLDGRVKAKHISWPVWWKRGEVLTMYTVAKEICSMAGRQR